MYLEKLLNTAKGGRRVGFAETFNLFECKVGVASTMIQQVGINDSDLQAFATSEHLGSKAFVFWQYSKHIVYLLNSCCYQIIV